MNKEGKFADVPLRVKTWGYIVVVFAIALLHPISLLIFTLFLLYWGQREFYTIAIPIGRLRTWFAILTTVIITLSLFVLSIENNLLTILGWCMITYSYVYLKYRQYLFYLIIMTVYLLSISILFYIGIQVKGYKYLILLVVPMELNDVSQYMSGKLFGKTKITPNISPNKTAEGVIGGVVMTTIIFNLMYYVLFNEMITIKTILLAMALSLLGFLGDLTLSLVKRKANVKDTGTLLPGHGGLLDRVDSLLYTTPLFYITMIWLK
ncbi:phosphatidate cytidylyltransferase [Myroides sp. M-43]|uniref:phosphatidate cytidylyltransferase n=1 Tax=Myroides oncorhynchi TaxID=2893756 RepID=UPI001E3A282B|nr:phosphatidate cytidylyltransferase [Myroides oncorhynchi]MCC9044387.1 phosphatidate cytidylyltransferase [Myroides oncorhynchi]